MVVYLNGIAVNVVSKYFEDVKLYPCKGRNTARV